MNTSITAKENELVSDNFGMIGKRCDYCGKEIAEDGRIYMAGSICKGHRLSIMGYLIYKLKKLFISNK